MKRYTLYIFSALALLLAAAACTQDDAGTLPDGTQPLTLTAAIEGSADTRATVDNRWNGNETIALQVTDGDGTEWYDYTVDDKGNLSGEYYWTKPSPITVQGICPATAVESTTWSVKSDQSSDADYQSGDLLASELTNVNYGSTAHLTFRHQTAKVVVNVSREGLPDAIGATASDISLGIGEDENILMDGTFTLPTDDSGYGTWTPGTTEGSITPHLSGTTASGCVATYEALVIPQTIRSGAWLLTFNATKDDASYGPFYYMLQNDTEWKAGYKYTYNVTITLYGLQVSVDTGSMTWEEGTGGEGSVDLPI